MTALLIKTDRRVTPNAGLIRTLSEIFDLKSGVLASHNFERDDEIDMLGDCWLSGNDPLLLGPPGTGKTHIIENAAACVELAPGVSAETAIFDTLVFKDMSSDDMLGARSLPAMKAGKIERMMDGMLPTAQWAIVDEIFKASPVLMNAMLDILARRKLKVGGRMHDVGQLLLIAMASNEYPDREDLAAFKDRIVPIRQVQPVRSPDGRRAVLRLQDEFQANGFRYDTSTWPKMTFDEIVQARTEAMALPIPEAVEDKLLEAIQKFDDAGFPPSARRYGQMLKQMKARAYRRGRDHVTPDEMLVLADMAFNSLDERDAAYKIVIQFAGKFARKAAEMSIGLEPLLTSVDQMRQAITEAKGDVDAVEKALDGSYEVLRNLRRFKRQAGDEIRTGRNQGEDVRDLESLMTKIQQTEDYVEAVASGAEDIVS